MVPVLRKRKGKLKQSPVKKLRATCLTMQERIFVATQMELHKSATVVQQKFEKEFNQEPPSRLTIYRIHQKFIRTGSVANCIQGISGCKCSKRTNENITKIRKLIQNMEYPSTRRIGLSLNMSNRTVHKILRQDLQMHPYIIQRCQKLKPVDKLKRMEACLIMLSISYQVPSMKDRIIFSDEAVFHTSGFVNRKNCILWGEEKPHVVQEYVRSSPKVNVWCGVCADGIIGPYFHTGESVNGATYLELLKDFLFDNMPLNICQNAFFQQDGATAHYTLPVRRFLDKKFKKRWIGCAGPIPWPPYSPDLTVCDFWLWGYLKTRVYSEPTPNLQTLKTRITELIRDIPKEMCKAAVHSAFDRFEKCIAVNGDQVERYF